MSDELDPVTDLHLIIKGVRNSRDRRLFACSATDRATMVEAILAAGYRKPRVVTTAEELDTLPVGSVVLDGSQPPSAYQKALDDIWEAGFPYHHGKSAGVLAKGGRSLTVLHEAGK